MAAIVASGNTEANEASPLLANPLDSQDRPDSPLTTSPYAHRSRCTWPWLRVVALGIIVAVVSDVGESLYAAPKIRLFESVICTRYYQRDNPSLVHNGGHVPERFCKVDPVQDELASVLGWQLFFDSIPAILLPIPYGYLADRRGRKWILFMAMSGYTLSYAWTLLAVGALQLPLHYVWLSSIFHLVGGGPSVGTTLLTTVIADVVPSDLISIVFFYRFCTDLVADLTIPPLTSYLMSRNIWIPLIGAMLFQGSSTAMVLVMPETLPLPMPQDLKNGESSGSISTASSESGDDPQYKKSRKSWIRQTQSSFRFVTRDKTVAALVLTFLISKVGRQSTNVLFQYVSKRYGWTLSQAGLLLSVRAAVNIALFTVMLPAIASFVLPRVGGPALRDLLLARGSIILLLLGTIVLFLSATPALMIIGVIFFTLGTGFAPTARSLVTSLVESQSAKTTSDIGRLYAIISVMEGIGSLVAALGMSWALRLGIRMGKFWLGLPFGFAAVLFAVVLVIAFSIRLEKA